jgi:hypothetical protein
MVVSPDGERSEASVVSSAWRASGAAPPNIPECAACAIVRTVIRTDPVPRNEVVRVGRPSVDIAGVGHHDHVRRDEIRTRAASLAIPPADCSSDPSTTHGHLDRPLARRLP